MCVFLCVVHSPIYHIISLTSYNSRVTDMAPSIIFYFCRRDRNTHVSIDSTCCISLCRRMCGFVSGEQMDSAPSLLLSSILLAGVCVTWVCHRAWEPKRSHVIPPGTAISSSQHLPHLQPAAAWRSFSLRTLGERDGGVAADLTHAGPRGRSQPAVATSAAPACCLTVGQ